MKMDSKFWDDRYTSEQTQWDVGTVSTPMKKYIDSLPDKNVSILIPGCGNAYETAYLGEKGFTDVTLIDISPVLVNEIEKQFSNFNFKIICGDFFELSGQFDLILEQTFFCALDPADRESYATKMFELIKPGGKLAGVLFNRSFHGGPPFGGTQEEYETLFSKLFHINIIADCYNSIPPRKGSELFIEFMRTN